MKQIKIYICLLSLVAGIQISIAQTITFKDGPALKPEVALNIDRIIGEDVTSFYTLRKNSSGRFAYWVEKFNKQSLDMEYSTNLELLESKENIHPSDNSMSVAMANGQVSVVYDVFDKAADEKILYLKIVDEKGALKPREKLLSNPVKSIFSVSNTMYNCVFSADKTKFLIYTAGSGVDPANRILNLYDAKSGKLVYTKKAPSTINGAPSFFSVDKVDNSGNLTGIVFTGNMKEGTNKRYAAQLKSGEPNLTDIVPEPDNILKNNSKYRYSHTTLEKDGQRIKAGMYNDKVAEYDEKNPPELKLGIYFAIVDPKTNTATVETYAPFEGSVYQKLTYKCGDYEKRGTYPSDKNIVVKEIIENGGAYYVIAEHRYSITITSSSGNGSTNEYNRELVVAKFSASGKAEWVKLIPKYTRNGGSYDLLVNNGKLFVFYLEHVENEALDLNSVTFDNRDYKIGAPPNANAICVTIDASGNMTKKALFRNEKDRYFYTPQRLGLQLRKDNDVLIEYTHGEKNRFGIFTVN